MFGTCHWWAISPDHPWTHLVRRIQQQVGSHAHVPHITICTHSTVELPVPVSPLKFECEASVTQTKATTTEGTLWCLQIPVNNDAHLSVAYRWQEPFTSQEVAIVSQMCVALPCFCCTTFQHQVWECNRAPQTWTRSRPPAPPAVKPEDASLLLVIQSGDLGDIARFLQRRPISPTPEHWSMTRGNPQLLYLLEKHRRRLLWQRLLSLKCGP